MAPDEKPTHCRLAVILAKDASKGVIFRRGPSLWVQLILWDTARDIFTEGQWFKGRIYTERCDLSPDGTKLIYFAAKHYKPYGREQEYSNTWTAISHPPYFTALALWNEIGTYGGGGVFLSNTSVCLRQTEPAHKNHTPPAWFQINPETCEQRIYPERWRLQQNGWHVDEVAKSHIRNGSIYTYDPPNILSRLSADQHYRMTYTHMGYGGKARYGNKRMISYKLLRLSDNKEFPLSDTWADWDHQGRLVYVDKGQLFEAQLLSTGPIPKLLADFNPNQPREIKTPKWATEWGYPSSYSSPFSHKD